MVLSRKYEENEEHRGISKGLKVWIEFPTNRLLEVLTAILKAAMYERPISFFLPFRHIFTAEEIFHAVLGRNIC